MQAQRILKPEGRTVVAVDYREKETAGFLEMFGAVVNMDALVVGDFVCSDRVAVERKAHSDFVGSIIDGRLFEQAHHMRDHFEKPVFIIEGTSDRDISVNALKAAIATLATQYNASVLNTKNPKDTALTVFWLAKKEQHDAGRELAIMVGKKPKDEKRLQEEIVCGLPGVGPEISKRLLRQFGSVSAVFGAGEDELKKVKGIGNKLAARIHKISEKRY